LKIVPFIACLLTGAMLVYGTLDMPAVGDPKAPAHLHVADFYIEHSYKDTRTPNMVTAVLADYRSLDTLGEVIVIFIAGIATIILLSPRRQT